ncbi:hypothetical protein Tco_0021197 [Tanacetum coccineum]
MDLNAFIRTADPRKVRIIERARAENERPIVTVAKHRTVTLLPTLVVRPSGELSASVEREFIRDASVGDGGDQGVASVGGQDNAEPIVPIMDNVETETPRPKRTKKKRVTRGSERMPAASHPPKRLRADYGTTGGSTTGGKSPSVLNRLLQDSWLMVEHGIPALPTLPFITSSVTASPLEEGGDHTDSVTGPFLRHKQDRVIIVSQALSVALDICRGRVEKMERNLIERLPFLKGVFVSIDDPLSAEALIEPPVEVPATNVLSTVVIVSHSDPSVSVEDYDNPDLVDVVLKNVTPGPKGEEKINASAGGDLAFSKLDDEAMDAVL